MANRILRDWTQSENIDNLSLGAEVMFTRLIMKADDYGIYYANPKLLKAHLFPLRDIKETDIIKSLNELSENGIVNVYKVDGKSYLLINNFNQRLRQMTPKFPQPDDNIPSTVSNPPSTVSNPPLEKKGSRKEEEDEIEDYPFSDFWNLYPVNVAKAKCEAKWKHIKKSDKKEIIITLPKFISYKPFKDYTHPHPFTYLNQERWKDTLPEQPTNPSPSMFDRNNQDTWPMSALDPVNYFNYFEYCISCKSRYSKPIDEKEFTELKLLNAAS